MESKSLDLSIRLNAARIRRDLLARNGSLVFRTTLANLSDEEVVKKWTEHHTQKLKWIAEDTKVKKGHGRI